MEPLSAVEEMRGKLRAEILAKIAEGYAEAQRGELIDASDVRAHMEERKRAWLADHRKG
jgi:predicted transcriptional regulator